jgi:ATP-dependent RNA helicase DeaD
MEFKEMNISSETLAELTRNGIKTPTKIQEEVIVDAIKGHDIQAQSETGSGKTIAFAIPMIEKFEKGKGIQGLVLAPTRELARQITDEFLKFSKGKRIYVLPVYGGASIGAQIRELHRTDIVVGTPGRILDLLKRNELKLTNIKVVVLDEADRMLDMGFVNDIERIFKSVPKKPQTMFFSATYPPEIRDIAKRYLLDPKKVVLKSTIEKGKLLQYYVDVRQSDKFSVLVHFLKKETSETCLVFCKTKRMTDSLSKNLYKQGIKAKSLNGDLSQGQRDRVVEEFKDGRINILVATDVAARGIHIEDISHVYNYDMPDTPETYTHRIGRTARAGKTGSTINIVCDFDHDNFGRIMRARGNEIKKITLESYEKIPFKNESSGSGFQKKRFGDRNREGRGGERGRGREGEGAPRQRFGRSDERPRQSSGGFSGQRSFGRRPTRGEGSQR